jgi:molecular chaperone GrpE
VDRGDPVADRVTGPAPEEDAPVTAGASSEAASTPSGDPSTGPSESTAAPGPGGTPGAADPSATAGAAERPVGDESVEEEVAEAEQVLYEDLRDVAQERDEYRALAQRIQADFENYKKRMLRQQTEHLERAAEALVDKLLPVLDTFELALAHGEGLEKVHHALLDVLTKEGLQRIDPVGQAFDPTEHDAVAHEEGDGETSVAEVMRAGYRWKGKVLRPAMVKVKG